MKGKFKPFSTSLMGSWPRSEELLEASQTYRQKNLSDEDYSALVNQETEKLVRAQEAAGIDVITNGELARDNYISFVADKVPGIELMSVEEVMALTNEDDKDQLQSSLEERDVHNTGMNNPICTGKIDTDVKLDTDEMLALRQMTNHPLKATLPSPYLLTRSLWLEGVSDKAYASREDLGQDVLTLILNETKRLLAMGIEVIQIDDPILAEVVLSEDMKRGFY
ncbi:5-methyltetrahydropteroyltriglutamate--homocysteine methyltransferase [Aerococcus sp. HMSC062A02]|nr:5-methyltetrahydropteroyltriglutamate--homocysteine methyltransferase [Aerococcus sp. HMSC062A02]OHO45618.1 5-methyltetrahydropteroyltriglutamate--homocysteine methyltransferase [Aerococcus sp. HMSC035B07]